MGGGGGFQKKKNPNIGGLLKYSDGKKGLKIPRIEEEN